MAKFLKDSYGIHAMQNAEFTLCGMSFDHNKEDAMDDNYVEPVEVSAEFVTCLQCIDVIRVCKNLKYRE